LWPGKLPDNLISAPYASFSSSNGGLGTLLRPSPFRYPPPPGLPAIGRPHVVGILSFALPDLISLSLCGQSTIQETDPFCCADRFFSPYPAIRWSQCSFGRYTAAFCKSMKRDHLSSSPAPSLKRQWIVSSKPFFIDKKAPLLPTFLRSLFYLPAGFFCFCFPCGWRGVFPGYTQP